MSVIVDTSVWSLALRRKTPPDSSPAVTILQNLITNDQDEERFILLGISVYYRILVVCHCYRENDTTIRIISARKANKLEQKQYQEFLV